MRRSLGVVIGVACVAAAQAQLIYPIEQERELEAYVYGYLDGADDPNGQTDSAAAGATDMQPWVDSIEASVGVDPYYAMTGGAGQYSEIGDAALTAYGLTEQEVLIDPFLTDSQGMSESRYRVQFAVPETTWYQVSGAIAASVDVVGEVDSGFWQIMTIVSVTLDQIAGPVVYSEQAYAAIAYYDPNEPVVDTRSVIDTGELGPGVYELEVVATVDMPEVWGDMYLSTAFIGETSYIVEVQFLPAQPGPGFVPIDATPKSSSRGDGPAERRASVPGP